MVDGLKMIHDSWIQDALQHESHESGAANNEIQFHIWTFINSENGKDVWSFHSIFFHSHAALVSVTISSIWVRVRSVRLPFAKCSGKTENCWHHIVYDRYGMIRTENTLRMLCVSRIISLFGLTPACLHLHTSAKKIVNVVFVRTKHFHRIVCKFCWWPKIPIQLIRRSEYERFILDCVHQF